MSLLFECPIRGVFADAGGEPWSDQEIAEAIGGDIATNLAGLAELLKKGVAKRNERGAIYSKRMVKDEQTRQQTNTRVKRLRNGECNAVVTRNETPKYEEEVEEEVGVEVRCLEAQQIYELYPRKVAKPKALIAIHKAIEREAKRLGGEPEAIAYIKLQTQKFARAPATKAKVERGEIEFIPHPSTWFNQERFNDEAEWRRPENGNSKAAPTKGGHNLEILKRSLGFNQDLHSEGGDDDGPQAGGVRTEPVGRTVIEMEPQGD